MPDGLLAGDGAGADDAAACGGATPNTPAHTNIPPHTPTNAVLTDCGYFVEVTNGLTKQWFRGIDELIGEDQVKHKMNSNLLMLACVRTLPTPYTRHRH